MLRRIFLIFGYFCGVAAIVAITAGLVAYGNDYTYDFGSRSIIQKGHVIIDSLPAGVGVVADGKTLDKKTPYQAAYKTGMHSFGLTKEGFRAWEKTLKVVAGRVALVNYVILVPKKPTETTLDTRAQIVAQAISKDHRHLAYITGGTEAAVYTLDLGNKKVQKLYVPKAANPTAMPAGAAELLQQVAWSDDASHVLISSDIGGTPQYRLATASGGGELVDLTQVFGFNLTGLRFSGSNWRQLYWISPDGLRRLDVGASTVSGVLAEKVTQFWAQPDHVLYVQQTEFGRSLWSLDAGGKRQELIQALVESDTYAVAETRYNGTNELVVVPAKTGIATLYTDIFGDTPTSKVLARGVSGASFAPDGRLLALTSATSAQVYDLERSELEQSLVIYSVAGQAGNLTSLTWFGNSHLLAVKGDELYWSEFDGANSVDFGKVYNGLPAYSDPDNKSIIQYRPSDLPGVKVTLIQVR